MMTSSQMEAFSALLVICAGNSPITGAFPAQRPVMRNFNVSFDLRLNERLSKQTWCWWFESPSRLLWRHSNVNEFRFISCASSLNKGIHGCVLGTSLYLPGARSGSSTKSSPLDLHNVLLPMLSNQVWLAVCVKTRRIERDIIQLCRDIISTNRSTDNMSRSNWILSRSNWIMSRSYWIMSRSNWIMSRSNWIMSWSNWVMSRY